MEDALVIMQVDILNKLGAELERMNACGEKHFLKKAWQLPAAVNLTKVGAISLQSDRHLVRQLYEPWRYHARESQQEPAATA